MRVVVAGGAGFLGSHLCRALVSEGHSVLALDNLVTGKAENLADLLGEARFELRRADVTVAKDLDVEGRVDVVSNMASPASPADYLALPIETLEAGSLGTRNTLELALAKGARYLMASTSEVYGDPLEHPQNERYWGNVNPVGPRSVYDEAKRFSEALVTAYHRFRGLDVRIVRIFNTYGPGMRPGDGRAVSTFLSQALAGEPLTVFGDGSQTRSFCYVDDEVAGIQALLQADYTAPVNIGNPQEYSILELAKIALEVTGSSSVLRFGPLPIDDPRQRRPDISLARSLTGWQPQVAIADGMARTAKWLETQM